MAFRILSIDGGGSRGIIPAKLLDHLDKTVPGPLLNHFDLLIGTSTGGIICLALAFGLSPAEIADFYRNETKKIFKESLIDRLSGGLDEHLRADFNVSYLKKLLSKMLGDATLGDLHARKDFGGAGKEVMICSFDLNPEKSVDGNFNYRPALFHSAFQKDRGERLVDLALRTSAGPTYFPIYQRKYIDGGVAMNNPSMAGISYAVNNQKALGDDADQYLDDGFKGLRKSLDEIHVLSLGTGTSNLNRIEASSVGNGNWGNIQWIKYLPDLLTESNIQATNYYAANTLPDGHFFRINPNFDNKNLADGRLAGKKIPMTTTNSKLLSDLERVADDLFLMHEAKLLEFLGKS